ncbi:17-beta-hydroxysteroid dehydrogenase 14-like [Mercenaria mercenaria]|uniref:17-beta-hydroxysteroid dehydrogenase 14-like n=1 Tax=Mercenaria mercenaria TaxID=6596 RepID=UPI00234F6A60|nr:17-beta-hydroxysteroid dehydrogenase 14-like [Mercenaria mercenaria]
MSATSDSHGLRFKDKVAIVTGGCCGIGRGCVDVMAEQGGKIAVLDLNDKVGNTLSSVSTSGEIFYVHCDMTKEEEIKNAIKQVAEKYGQIDCLVNNVGTHPGSKTIDELTVEGFKDLLNLNLVSNFTASKYALPYLRKSKGNIVNITSISAHSGTGLASSYCATKGGCLSLTKALAIDEAKNGVRVNSVSPGCIDTPLFRSVEKAGGREIDEERLKYIGSLHTLNRIGQPREIGKACLFLAVDATFTTGEELMCTGGCELGSGVKYALPYLRKSKGNIVNITSTSAHSGTGLASSYCATKGGCLSLTKALAIDEAKNGVRVNSVSPGCIDTPLFRSVEKAGGREIDEERLKYLGSLHTLNRIGQPREIGKACLFLAVDATFTTGEELMCTGGCEVGYGVKQ